MRQYFICTNVNAIILSNYQFKVYVTTMNKYTLIIHVHIVATYMYSYVYLFNIGFIQKI